MLWLCYSYSYSYCCYTTTRDRPCMQAGGSSLPSGQSRRASHQRDMSTHRRDWRQRNSCAEHSGLNTHTHTQPAPADQLTVLLQQNFSRCSYQFPLGSRVVSVLDSGAEGPGIKSQSRRCRVTVLGKLFTPIVPLFTKQQNW